MSTYKNCVNCGTQNLTDEYYKPADKCYHCGQPIGIKAEKKEETMSAELHTEGLPEEQKTENVATAIEGFGQRLHSGAEMEKPIPMHIDRPPIQSDFHNYSKEDRKKITEHAKATTFSEASVIYHVPKGVIRVWNMNFIRDERAAATGTTPPKPDGKKKLKKCKKCESYLIHDEQPWCTSKICPKKYPKNLRPPYRPPEVKPVASETPIAGKSKREKKPKAPPVAPRTVPQSIEEADEVCASCPVVQALKGYRLAVKDIMGARIE